ncbi:uncharacterized protein [Haliotis cracherodii]|uniref:uncharacterized protein n=1 Tax=Haliotis cracherodii TaxID=6455 RepID=UPI0039EB9106
MNPEIGYFQARKLLLERFGNQYVIAKAWVDKVTDVPNLKPNDSAGLRGYADSLRSCVVSLTAMSRLGEIDNQLRMRKIVEKLPFFIQGRWRKEAVNVLKRNGQYPGIGHLAEFIEIVAEELDDPVFGINVKDSTEKPPPQRTSFKCKSASNFIAQGNITQENRNLHEQPQRACKCCTGSHPLYQCPTFKKMNLQKRLEFTIRQKLCFNCFSSRHLSPRCMKDSMCDNSSCKQHYRKHSSLLHDSSRTSLKSVKEPMPDSQDMNPMLRSSSCSEHAENKIQSSSVYGVNGAGGTRIALPIVPVCVKGCSEHEVIKTYALLDPGSTNTFCFKDLANTLKLDGSGAMLSLNTLTDKGYESQTEVVSLSLTDINGRHATNMSNVFVLSQMPVLEGSAVSRCDVDKWKHFQGIDLPMVEGKFAKVTVLIGQDNPLVLTPLEVRSGKADEPYATKTIFGWAINGPLHRGIQQDMTSNFVQVEANLESQVEKFWHLDNVSDGRSQLSFHDKQVIQLWDNTVEREKRHYKLPIPFKVNPPNLPNNFCMAETRLVSLTKKLSRNDDMYEHYKAGIDDMVYKGYAEKVPDDEVCIDEGSVWYLPHHVVTSDKKPGKFRIVFDCSAKFGGISLNESVHQGPDLTNTLMGVLLRFREKRIAIAGDIESMYHRVKVADQHRNALRFLWWKNGELGGDIEVFRMTSHLFGGIWSSSCANYALRKTAADNADDFDKDTIQTVTDNFYVDDCLKSVDSKEKGMKLVQNVCDLLQRGGFRLTKWTSNSRTVLQSIPVEERAKELEDINLCDDELPQEKALGVKWDTETDQLGFKFQPKNRPATKRGLLSILTSVYDPIGFLSPLILKAKMIFQDECRLRKGWDTALESISHERWSNWLSKLCHIEDFTVPRCVIPNDFCEMMSAELHHFADASIAGYGAVSYVRIVDSCGRIHCSFLMAKSRLAPIKSITIPRLELCAAVLSVKLDEMLRKELRMETEQSTFWTDSMIVLHYIKNDFQRYQTFVANRVTQIREGSSPQSWRYVQSSLNPADDASRGLDADELLAKENWLQGPSFLWENKDTWQKTPTVLPVSGEDLEVKKVKVNFASSDKVEPSTTDRLLSRYSSWYHLKKMVAWILRLKHCLLRRVREGNSEERISMEPLVVSEMKQAETEIVRYTQNLAFRLEVEYLLNDRSIPKSSPIYLLEPFLNQDGILCVGGRLNNAPISEESKHQMILPKGHDIVTLIVRCYHEQLGHSGTEHVLSHVRQRFWVISARRTIRKVLKDCVKCKRLQGKRSHQKMANLPEDRVTPGKPPFAHTGVDCFGPFLIKRGRSEVKRYGCIFTCLTTRAIHLEKLDSMDTDSFITALRRFEARRGVPDIVRSDNGTNFRGAQKELREAIRAWNHHEIQEHMLQKEIQWMFNPPSASHMGGVWERQIRTVRKVLNALLYQQHGLHDEGLSTLFCEVEAIVNSRPITIVSDSPSDMEPLTPNHILLLRSGNSLPPGRFSVHDAYRRRWKHVQFLADQFWKRWLKEYLPGLQLRQKWLQSTVNLKVGDIVLLVNENSPRCVWPLARITNVFPGNDGLVRSIEVKTKDSVLIRPISKVCLLESVSDA